ncbi:hypothetical protein PR048_012752 [Dryococelus australis]|uniref:Uncharacterized protein n=1 Tax=Dryococelus australis TaxID=614101 RepID=A0ABQ9HQD5_9NEOP|nr:hypothetical protein PR048_012752 [Dryococelus australis]
MDTDSPNNLFELNDLPHTPESSIVRYHSYLDFNSYDSASEEKNDHNDEDELPNLVIENTSQKENIVTGNRVVDPLYFIKQM